jgi:pyruvate dehydrogenase E1 component alpha subunit
MMRIRAFENRLLELIERKELELGFHLMMGHEATAVGVCKALKHGDYITSNHRTLGRYLALGGDSRRIMAEIFGKKSGLCKGKAGEMLIADKSVGFLFSSVTVGAGIPVATGAALAIKYYLKTNQVVASFFGDAASCNGPFHEALNLAAVHKAPVIFVCENNGLSINVPQSQWMSTKTVAERAAAYGIPGESIDGTDVEEVFRVATGAIERARSGAGPTLIDAETIRLRPHKEGLADSRSQLELKEAWKRDPLAVHLIRLKNAGILNDETQRRMKEAILTEMEEAVNFARNSPFPDDSELFADLFSPKTAEAFSSDP